MMKSPVVQILEECIALYDLKASDYDNPLKHDGLANFRVAREIGIPPYVGAIVRMMDKVERIKTLTYKRLVSNEGPAVKDETIEDTLKDLINYGAIVLALYREETANADPSTASDRSPTESEGLPPVHTVGSDRNQHDR